MRNEILTLANTPLFDEVEVTVDELKLPPPPPAPPSVRAAPTERDPIYLFVREVTSRVPRVRKPSDPFTLQTSVLTAGSRATVVTAAKDVDTNKLDQHLEEIEKRSFNFNALDAFGTDLGDLVLPPLVAAVLKSISDRHIVVIHDATAARIPWETLRVNGRFLAQKPGLSRKYEAPNLSVAKWLEQRRLDPVLNMLLVVNPTEDLPGADREGKRILDILGSESNVEIEQLWHQQASWSAVRAAFRSGKYDVVHYAGHAFFDPVNRGHSGIVCHGEQVLSGADLVNLENLPSLVFFNACEAGRVRGADKRKHGKATRVRLETNIGLAEAFLRGGVANYVGTYWPVGDEAAEKFASEFYQTLREGKSIGAALGRGREQVYELSSVDWADYVHYGSPGFVVKRRV
jgi:CHAT domain-containing protein